MNRKGFAITTVIYGLALLGVMIVTMLMGILSTTRSNVSRESERIENILINYNLSSKVYKNSSSEQDFTVPAGETGWYRIEAFGASGNEIKAEPTPPEYTGNAETDNKLKEDYKKALEEYESTAHGEGAYTTGIIYLEEGDSLKLKVGSAKGSDTSTYIYYNSQIPANLLMKAAGGKGSTPGGTLQTQSAAAKGATIDRETTQLKDKTDINGSKGIIYGGGTGNTSQISGYPGGSLQKITVSATKDLYFVDGLMIPAVNRGHGSVIIERIKEDEDYYNARTDTSITLENQITRIPRTNKKLNNVKKIKINVSNTSLTVSNVYYSVAGTITPKTCNARNCEYTLSPQNIDDITILFNKTGVVLSGVEIKVTNDKGEENSIYDSSRIGTESGIMSTPTGIKISAYQPDTTTDITPHGNYYILPITEDALAVSAMSSSQEDSGIIGAERLNGEARQRWAIDLINIPNKSAGEPNFANIRNESGMREYRIIDLARAKALDVYRDENRNNGTVSASQTFNALSRNAPQIWNIRSMSDGTFAIKTVQESLDANLRSGYLYINTTADSDNRNKLIIGAARDTKPASDILMEPTQPERFILYSIDFASATE